MNDPKLLKNQIINLTLYSSSKASSDHLSRVGIRHINAVIITHCSNNFGPYQNLEKLIPNVIIRAYNKNQSKFMAKVIK